MPFGAKAKERKVTPPSPAYMDSKQFAAYLTDLRNNRVNRPGGARPQPATATYSPSTSRRDSARLSYGARPSLGSASVLETPSRQQRSQTPSQPERSMTPSMPSDPKATGRPSLCFSVSSRYSSMSQGRDYIPERPVKPLKPSEVVPSATYMERGQRWMEKEEAFSLRQAMDDVDIQEGGKKGERAENEDDQRIYEAALDEAAELVWQHQNPGKSPEPGAPYRYTPHLRKNSYAHARAASAGLYGGDVAPTGMARDSGGSCSVSGSSSGSDAQGSTRSRSSFGSTRRASGLGDTGRPSLDGSRRASSESKKSRPYGAIAGGPSTASSSHRRRSSLKRNISGEVERPFSGDQIWEEPERQNLEKSKDEDAARPTSNASYPLGTKPRNPMNRVQFAPDVQTAEDSPPPPPPKVVSRHEIHKNPPTQSRNPQYTMNMASERPSVQRETAAEVPRKNGVEIRGDDIRQATSMRLSDRSVKLPTPSAVSDNPSRPIVSFNRDWKPLEEATDEKPEEQRPRTPTVGRTLVIGSTSSGSDSPRVDKVNSKVQLGGGFSPAKANDKATDKANSNTKGNGGVAPIPGRNYPFVRRGLRSEQRQQEHQQQAQVQVSAMASSQTPLAPAPSPKPQSHSRSLPQPTSSPPVVQVDGPPAIPSICVSDPDPIPAAPSIPSIAVSDGGPAIPTVVLPEDQEDGRDMPVIVTPDEPTSTNGKPRPGRPLPTPGSRSAAPRRHWSPAPGSVSSRATARCHECGHPIEGRIVSLAGTSERFHPQCFRCFTCGTSLEALEISPEPDAHRAARLERVARRARGEMLPEKAGETAAEDRELGDDRLRYYCHLDWHEHFAPRCKHCNTPILGPHVVALGAHWHEGHFFCAECGDPFTAGMTHIEKDGYAWCVNCQTKRTERRAPKCRACKTAVIGQYVRALGGEWHDECFRCATCGGGFDDGQIFPMEGRGVLCTGCRQRELKA